MKLRESSEDSEENDLLGMMIAATMGELQGNQRSLRMGMSMKLKVLMKGFT